MEIIRGKINSAKKVTVYGPEGIGKSTFSSRFPNPLFIDIEGSTKEMDVARTPAPSSWTMLLEQIEYIKNTPGICGTLVIDTIDWAEQMCIEHICAKHSKSGIEDFGYGNGYVYVKEEFGRFLNRLTDIVERGINVVLTAHAQIRKFEQPDEMGAYDRYELKLGKKTSSQTSPLVKEWADMVLFANYKTYSVATDDKGKKHKAQGGARVMYTAHHPCWDAKNRHGLPEELPFDYAGISHIFSQPTASPPVDRGEDRAVPGKDAPESAKGPETQAQSISQPPLPPQDVENVEAKQKTDMVWESSPDKIPKALIDLMQANRVTEWDIQNVVAARGYYPSDVPIEKYDPSFISGVLVATWGKVYGMIQEIRESGEIPFN